MSKVEVNQVTQQCGTTLTVGGGACKTAVVDATTVTLGRCGGTVSLASGATQSGFGRTGTVDWDTSIKTGTVTAVSGSGYFVDTTSTGITVNLPAAAVGSIVAVSDYASTADSNNITISPNGSEKINGVNDTYIMSTAGLAVTLVYADATRGWKSVTGSDADATGEARLFVAATGGTPCAGATSGDYKIHSFTGPGTLTITCAGNAAGNNKIDYLVVAGGGAGPATAGGDGVSGGGGGGGYRESVPSPAAWTAAPIASPGGALTATPSPIGVTVGGGGSKGTAPTGWTNGDNSVFSTITSTGGGRGGRGDPSGCGQDGGSGGGAANGDSGGSGNTPATPIAQGFDGGPSGCGATGGGGGGATVVGQTTPGNPFGGGAGGAGATTCISATPTAYAGGGGGGSGNASPQPGGAGGTGGGAVGRAPGCRSASCGTCNTGGGGGGTSDYNPGGGAGGNGGSGIVIVRYKFQ